MSSAAPLHPTLFVLINHGFILGPRPSSLHPLSSAPTLHQPQSFSLDFSLVSLHVSSCLCALRGAEMLRDVWFPQRRLVLHLSLALCSERACVRACTLHDCQWSPAESLALLNHLYQLGVILGLFFKGGGRRCNSCVCSWIPGVCSTT